MSLTDEKFSKKQALLVERTALALNIPASQAKELLKEANTQSVRLNSLVAALDATIAELHEAGVTLEPVEWAPYGYKVSSGMESLMASNASQRSDLYIQNAASWLPVIALEPGKGESILDVCAAPGGKTSYIAQLSGNKASIVANDNSRPRLLRLQNNLSRLGVENTTFTLHDAAQLARHFPAESFDKILLDAPCSGEGMMQLDRRKDFESWSVAHIKRLQQLQKRIASQAWELLKPGGVLIYSTCTMAPEENEAVIHYLTKRFYDMTVETLPASFYELAGKVEPVHEWNGKQFNTEINNVLRLAPNDETEAFFVAKLVKS